MREGGVTAWTSPGLRSSKHQKTPRGESTPRRPGTGVCWPRTRIRAAQRSPASAGRRRGLEKRTEDTNGPGGGRGSPASGGEGARGPQSPGRCSRDPKGHGARALSPPTETRMLAGTGSPAPAAPGPPRRVPACPLPGHPQRNGRPHPPGDASGDPRSSVTCEKHSSRRQIPGAGAGHAKGGVSLWRQARAAARGRGGGSDAPPCASPPRGAGHRRGAGRAPSRSVLVRGSPCGRTTRTDGSPRTGGRQGRTRRVTRHRPSRGTRRAGNRFAPWGRPSPGAAQACVGPRGPACARPRLAAWRPPAPGPARPARFRPGPTAPPTQGTITGLVTPDPRPRVLRGFPVPTP